MEIDELKEVHKSIRKSLHKIENEIAMLGYKQIKPKSRWIPIENNFIDLPYEGGFFPCWIFIELKNIGFVRFAIFDGGKFYDVNGDEWECDGCEVKISYFYPLEMPEEPSKSLKD